MAEPSAGIPDEEFAALMQKLTAFAPLMRGTSAPDSTAPEAKGGGKRETLLAALKPYLSPERRAAADYLIHIWRALDALRALR